MGDEKKNEQANIEFTLDEVNQMLEYLGNVPAKHSLDLIQFIRSRAQAQLAMAEAAKAQAKNPAEAE